MVASFIPSILDELDDVAVISPVGGQVIRYNGVNWVNAQLAHGDLSGVGVNTHAQIDTHISATTNPHGTTLTQSSLIVNVSVGIGTITPDTRLDIEDGAISFLAMTPPANPVADKAALYVDAAGVSPTRTVALKAKFQNGTVVTLASVTV